ncbi:HAD-IB family hydrolase [Acinetobacter qingfengensis]|uniref:Uncharacterized protein n=1 Tax=Acinetobacter qingfengensis TaxID=1262585 RepID=A0A1E7R5N4_9GAMM|nr:HAD-IB family hydrolase [Acinetobacter qingfengensis]KAA8735595.1 HAD-IB family hydrolase [Acinetobacter qingfengensis]OEY94638.1 hypothetical protein BJI46_13405 [Acinetobacter qingfengensis]
MSALALFDFDGTLCEKDSFTGFMHYVFDKPYFYKKSLKVLPQIIAYYAKIYPPHRMRPELYRQMFKHYPVNKAKYYGEQFAHYLYYSALNQQLLERLQWHQQQQHHVVIVSASLDLYLEPLAQRLGVELICTKVDCLNNQLTGFYASRDCSNQEKIKQLICRLNPKDYESIYAYGNSREDYAMLKFADHAFWVDKNLNMSNFEN